MWIVVALLGWAVTGNAAEALAGMMTVPGSAVATLGLSYRSLTMEEGLRSNTVRSLLQDRDGFIWGKLREVAHYYLYSMSRSNLINGLSKEVAGEDFTPWWKPALIGVNAALGVLALGALALFTVSTLKARKKEE